MARQTKKKAESNKPLLILKINGEEREIATFDTRKFDIINYYIQQNDGAQSSIQSDSFIESLVNGIVSGFDKEVDKQYKKYVPKEVRKLYESYLINSPLFGGIDDVTEQEQENDKLSATVPSPAAAAADEKNDE